MLTRADLERRYDGPIPAHKYREGDWPAANATVGDLDAAIEKQRRLLRSSAKKVRLYKSFMVKMAPKTSVGLSVVIAETNLRKSRIQWLNRWRIRNALIRRRDAARVPDTVAAE